MPWEPLPHDSIKIGANESNYTNVGGTMKGKTHKLQQNVTK